MKKQLIVTAFLFLICAGLSAQNLEPQKDKITKKYGYVNKAGEWVVPATYDDANKFKDGTAVISLNKKDGLISETGTVLIEPKFDEIEKFKHGIALIKNSKKYGFIDKTGKILCEPKYDDIDKFSDDGIAIIKTGKKLGLIKNDGTELTAPQFDVISAFNGEFASIQNNKVFGLINKAGKVIFEPAFDNPLAFNKNGLAIVSKTPAADISKVGIVKNDGSTVLAISQLMVKEEGVLFFVLQSGGKWAILDANAKLIKEVEEINPSSVGYNDNGLIIAREGQKWGFIDATGRAIIPFKFDKIADAGFGENYCAVKVGEKWGYIDRKGSYFKAPIYESADRFRKLSGDVLATVTLDGKEYILSAKTGEITLKVTGPATTAAATTTPAATASPTTTTTTTQAAASTDEWLKGVWKVTEEKMAGKIYTGNDVTTVSFDFQANGRGSYVKRIDVMANKTSVNDMEWSLSGSSLKISGVNYTLTPSADKKSMSMSGILGSSWKLVKQ